MNGGKNAEYRRYPEENNLYFIEYFDNIGAFVQLPIDSIWGFCSEDGIFVSFEGKPYELIYLGAISILRYDHIFHKEQSKIMVDVALFGASTVAAHKIKDAYLDLLGKKIYTKKRSNFEEIISKDSIFHNRYLDDIKTKKKYKPLVYFPVFNQKYPILIKSYGIILPSVQQ